MSKKVTEKVSKNVLKNVPERARSYVEMLAQEFRVCKRPEACYYEYCC